VIATSPLNSTRSICKRVHRIGGEIYDGFSDSDVVVPYGYVYLIGDNSEISRDSNDYGAIPYGLIQSRVLMRVIFYILKNFFNDLRILKNYFKFLQIWPLKEFKLFPEK